MIYKRNFQTVKQKRKLCCNPKNKSIEPRLTKNWKIFTDVLNSNPILENLKTRFSLLKMTYSENQQTKLEFQLTITII